MKPDAEIKRAAETALRASLELDQSEVAVSVRQSVVALTGEDAEVARAAVAALRAELPDAIEAEATKIIAPVHHEQ